MCTQTGKHMSEVKRGYMEDRRRRNQLENIRMDSGSEMSDSQLFWAAQYFGVTVEEVYQPEYLAKLKRASLDLV
jgi:hypothetical protein